MTKIATQAQTALGTSAAPPSAESKSGPARPRHVGLGASLLGSGALAAFFMMSQDRHLAYGPFFGSLAVLIATAGLLELLGLLRSLPGDERPSWFAPKEGEHLWLSPRVTAPAAAAITALSIVVLGPGRLAVPLALSLLVLGASALRRPALFVFVAASLLLLPTLGEFGLWDPWETHYGEVAREILSRDDWITLWWAQDELFRSKPVFIFWIEALAWGALGVPFAPDSNPGWPEWPIRLPHYLLTIGSLLACYAAMARFFGRRAAVLGSLVLATTPYFFLLAHQAITDMPFVATMSAALALLMLAVEDDPERVAKTYRLGPLAVSAQSVVIAAFVLVALPQVLYLITRNLTFVWADHGFWAHRDEFLFGSAGNEKIPGNPTHRMRVPYLSALYFQPFAQGLLWLGGLALLVWILNKERRTQPLTMFGFYLLCSLAWMAKGIPGFALPGLIAALYLLVTQRWSLLLSGKLRVAGGILTIAVTGLPWYVAMYGRLGSYFTDRLLIHDHLNRLAQGVHGDTGGVEYFLSQLGYGAFPWLALAPIGFAAYSFLFPDRDTPERRSALLLSLWAAAAFVLFNAMITKFHHYIFPAVPPLALLIGVVLDRLIGPAHESPRERWGIALAALSPVPIVLGVGSMYGDPRGVVPANVPVNERVGWVEQHAWSNAEALALLIAGFVLLVLALSLLATLRDNALRASRLNAPLGAALIASATLMAFMGRDLSYRTSERPLGHERLVQLFIYNYQRPFPEHLDYRPILSGFAVVAFGFALLLAAPKLQRLAVYGLLGTTFWFAAWTLDVYMIDLTPHWGQRELAKTYYEARKGPEEPLIAWQMNWKGENLYTGNRVYTFVQLDNKAITRWLEQNDGKRAFFVLEHSRMGSFKRLMGKRTIEALTTVRDNNKFVLVRAEI